MEDEHGRIYQNVVAEHEPYMERAVLHRSLWYICQLSEAGRPKDIRAERLQDDRVRGNKHEILAAVAESFQRQQNQGQQGCSNTTQRMGVHGGTKPGHTSPQGNAGER